MVKAEIDKSVLWDSIRKIADSDVLYLAYKKEVKVSIGNYRDLKPYSAQAEWGGKISVNFMMGNSMVIFKNTITDRKEDRDSYEKYSGLIYIYEPLTKKLEREILSKVIKKLPQYKKMADGGEVGTTYQKGDRVLVKDGRVTRMATIVADGIDSNKRVRVRIDEFPFDKSIPVRPSNEIYVLEKMAKGGKTKQSMSVQFTDYKGKQIMFEPFFEKYYTNDIEFDTMEEAKKYIDGGSKKTSWQVSAYRTGMMAKGGGIDEDREIHTFLVQVISEIGDTQYTIDANDGVQAFHKARYLFKKDNPNYKGDIDLSMIDKYAKGGLLGGFNYSIGGL